MSFQYPHKIRPWLKNELARLSKGNADEKQRYQKALVAINTVIQNPLHRNYSKALPENFKAVHALAQYVVFFKIIPAAIATDNDCDTVYFVWINDESSIHRSGEPDDAYQVFRSMIVKGQIEDYLPDPKSVSQNFNIRGAWGDSVVYADYSKTENSTHLHSSTHLSLSKISNYEYRIDYVTVSEENRKLASSLLLNICAEADKRKILLVFELGTTESHAQKSHHLLEKFSFTLDQKIEDQEVWVRNFK